MSSKTHPSVRCTASISTAEGKQNRNAKTANLSRRDFGYLDQRATNIGIKTSNSSAVMPTLRIVQQRTILPNSSYHPGWSKSVIFVYKSTNTQPFTRGGKCQRMSVYSVGDSRSPIVLEAPSSCSVCTTFPRP